MSTWYVYVYLLFTQVEFTTLTARHYVAITHRRPTDIFKYQILLGGQTSRQVVTAVLPLAHTPDPNRPTYGDKEGAYDIHTYIGVNL